MACGEQPGRVLALWTEKIPDASFSGAAASLEACLRLEGLRRAWP